MICTSYYLLSIKIRQVISCKIVFVQVVQNGCTSNNVFKIFRCTPHIYMCVCVTKKVTDLMEALDCIFFTELRLLFLLPE